MAKIKTVIVPVGDPFQEVPTMPRKICGTCSAWRARKDLTAIVWGGCARGGQTTVHYGDTKYNHYTTDLQTCSAWEGK